MVALTYSRFTCIPIRSVRACVCVCSRKSYTRAPSSARARLRIHTYENTELAPQIYAVVTNAPTATTTGTQFGSSLFAVVVVRCAGVCVRSVLFGKRVRRRRRQSAAQPNGAPPQCRCACRQTTAVSQRKETVDRNYFVYCFVEYSTLLPHAAMI